MMTLSLNNQLQSLDDNTTLSAFLEQYPPGGSFAVALNGEFVPRSRYADTLLAEGDELDIVAPVGGG
jgi:sulfur carrier protein